MRKIVATAAAIALAGTCFGGVAPATAVTHGEPDGNGHPYVGIMTAWDADDEFLWRCSGSLLSSAVFLTAGHCTMAPVKRVEIWFDADIDAGMPGNGYPRVGQVSGTPFTHPQFEPDAFYRYDLGVVVLDSPVPMAVYAQLPPVDSLDGLNAGKTTTFTAVGYGSQRAFPLAASWKDESRRLRMVSHPRLVQISTPGRTGDYSMIVSSNASTGGTCYGDSGGPNLLEESDVIAGVTSNGHMTCGGNGGVYRLDQTEDHDWLADFDIFPAAE